MKHNTKQIGLCSNIIYDNRYYVFDDANDIKICCDKSNIIKNNLNSTIRMKKKKIYSSVNEQEIEINNQLFNGKKDFYSNKLQQEFFDKCYKDSLHVQLAHSIDKIKKIIGFYLNSIVYTMNAVSGNYDGDILSMINYHYSWDEYDPSRGKSKIRCKDDFNRFVYKLCRHNSLFSNVFMCDKNWNEEDYIQCDEEVKEYNYDVVRILSMLRNFSAHGTDREKDSMYLFCSDDIELKNESIGKWGNMDEILSNKAYLMNKRIIDETQSFCNDIYKTLYLFFREKKDFKKVIDYDYIFESVFYANYDKQLPLAKLSRYIISKLANNKKIGNRNYKYYQFLSKQENRKFNHILYFYLDLSLSLEDRMKMKEIYYKNKNIDGLYSYLLCKKIIDYQNIKKMVKYYYIIGKKEVALYAKTCHCTPYASKKERGFSIDYGKLDKKMWQQYLMIRHFETKAQLFCNINKVSQYKEGQRVRNLSFHNEKLRKDKIWSIHEYIKQTEKLKCWQLTKKVFENEYEKNRYLQIRKSIIERVMITVLYTNRKYYSEYVKKNIGKQSFGDYLNKKDKGWINDKIKTACYDYDRLKTEEYKYSKQQQLFELDVFSKMIMFICNFVDKSNANKLCNAVRKQIHNVDTFAGLWDELDKNNIKYNERLSVFEEVNDISKNMVAVCTCIKLKSKNFDGYDNVIEYISKMSLALKVTWNAEWNYLHSVYLKTKYYNSMIKYVNPYQIAKIVENEKLIEYGISCMRNEECDKYKEFFKVEANKLSLIIKGIKHLTMEESIVCCSLIGSIVNDLVERILKINSSYYLAFSFLERDLNMLYGEKLDNDTALRCSDEFVRNFGVKKKKYKEEYAQRKAKYDKRCFKIYRNVIAHMNCVSMISEISEIKKVENDFDLYHFLLQKYLFSKECFKRSQEYSKYISSFEEYGTPSRELIKILNLPFVYKPSRYNKLSYRTVFNSMNQVFDEKKKFF